MFIQESLTEVILRIEEMNKHSHLIVERKQVMRKFLKHKAQLRAQTAERREKQ